MSTPKTIPTPKHRPKSQAKRQQIIAAASDLFLDNGFERVSMDQIADSAGVSKQTVYSHFGSKDELFSATIEFKMTIHEITDELLDLERPIHEVLRELATHLSELLMSREAICMYRVCIADVAQRSRIAELFWQAGPAKLTQRFCDYLTEQNRLGALNISNPHFAAQQFLYMIKGEAYLQNILGQPNDKNLQQLPAYLDSCVNLFEKAYLQ